MIKDGRLLVIIGFVVMLCFAYSLLMIPSELREGVFLRMEEIRYAERIAISDLYTRENDVYNRLEELGHKIKCLQVETDVSLICTEQDIEEHNKYKQEEEDRHSRYLEMKELNQF